MNKAELVETGWSEMSSVPFKSPHRMCAEPEQTGLALKVTSCFCFDMISFSSIMNLFFWPTVQFFKFQKGLKERSFSRVYPVTAVSCCVPNISRSNTFSITPCRSAVSAEEMAMWPQPSGTKQDIDDKLLYYATDW